MWRGMSPLGGGSCSLESFSLNWDCRETLRIGGWGRGDPVPLCMRFSLRSRASFTTDKIKIPAKAWKPPIRLNLLCFTKGTQEGALTGLWLPCGPSQDCGFQVAPCKAVVFLRSGLWLPLSPNVHLTGPSTSCCSHYSKTPSF